MLGNVPAGAGLPRHVSGTWTARGGERLEPFAIGPGEELRPRAPVGAPGGWREGGGGEITGTLTGSPEAVCATGSVRCCGRKPCQVDTLFGARRDVGVGPHRTPNAPEKT